MATIILWIYIVLLLAGGLMGFLKAGSKMSLITSGAFAAALASTATGLFGGAFFANILLTVLLGFFGARLIRGRKFMPAGLMTILTAVTLALRLVL